MRQFANDGGEDDDDLIEFRILLVSSMLSGCSDFYCSVFCIFRAVLIHIHIIFTPKYYQCLSCVTNLSCDEMIDSCLFGQACENFFFHSNLHLASTALLLYCHLKTEKKCQVTWTGEFEVALYDDFT